jgi:lysophospholipase L1-like esterase
MIGSDPERPERLDTSRIAAIDAAWTKAAREHGATLVDLDGTLCPNGVSDDAIRPDGAHFSGEGADQVAPIVAKAIRKTVAAANAGATS